MKGALRVALLQFTALPVQRWLLACGAVMVVAGYLLPYPAIVLALIGLIIAFMPTLFASGVLLRYIAAPRVTQLIPYARPQILGGMVLVPLILATAFTLVAPSLAPIDDHLLIWLRVAAGVSVWLVSQFVLISGARGTAIWFLILTIAVVSPGSTGTRDVMRWIGQSPALLTAALVVTWCGFAIWLLRGRPLRAPRVVSTSGWGAQNAGASYQNAVRAFLFGNPSLPAQFAGGLMLTFSVLLAWSLLALFNGNAHSFGEAFSRASWPALGLGTLAGLGGWKVALRSKFLWLRCGLDRRELFRLCEREAWKSFIASTSALLLLVLLVWLTNPSSGVEYTVQLAFQLCSGACLLYFGLMRVRGWRVADVLIGILLFSAWGTASGNSGFLAGHLWILLASCAVMLTAAFALRLGGLHRWRRIDWLVCRPPSPLARHEMNPAQ